MDCQIGSCISVSTKHNKCKTLLVAPTMRVPEPIVYTDNVYNAFYAILKAVEHLDPMVIGIPGMGTGCGQMSGIQCATQIKKAYMDRNKELNKDKLLIYKPGFYVLKSSVI